MVNAKFKTTDGTSYSLTAAIILFLFSSVTFILGFIRFLGVVSSTGQSQNYLNYFVFSVFCFFFSIFFTLVAIYLLVQSSITYYSTTINQTEDYDEYIED